MPPKEEGVYSIDSEEAFQNRVLESGSAKLYVVDVYTEAFGNCSAMVPTFKNLQMNTEQFEERCKFCMIERKTWPAFAERFSATSMPRFLFIKNGEEKLCIEGVRAPEILKAINEYMPELKTDDD